MNPIFDTGDDHPMRHGGFTLLGLAGGAVGAALLLALSTSIPEDVPETVLRDAAPTARVATALPAPPGHSHAAPARVAALDDGVDWSRVEAATDYGPAAVAAYER